MAAVRVGQAAVGTAVARVGQAAAGTAVASGPGSRGMVAKAAIAGVRNEGNCDEVDIYLSCLLSTLSVQ
jgi:hypothetical protein